MRIHSFIHLLSEFSKLRGALTQYHFCNFSQEISKNDIDYFGSGVQFILPGFVDEDLEIIVDFDTFLEMLSEVIEVFILFYPERKKEVHGLFQIIKERIYQ